MNCLAHDLSNLRWLLCECLLGHLNKYIRHRTAVISQLTSRGAAAIHSHLLTPWASICCRFAASGNPRVAALPGTTSRAGCLQGDRMKKKTLLMILSWLPASGLFPLGLPAQTQR